MNGKERVIIELQPFDENCCTPPRLEPPDLARIAGEVKLLSALADPTRLQIVTLLAGQDEPLCVCDILCHFELGQPTVSHHLKVLRDAGLVSWEKHGLWVYYSLRHEVLDQVASHLNSLLSKFAVLAG